MSGDTLPVSYPPDDDVKYLEFYKDRFSKVFVAFNPFIRVTQFPQQNTQEFLSEEVLVAAKRCGTNCGVSWSEVADLCQFPTVEHVNRALRWTGSKRLAADLVNEVDTQTLITTCGKHGILIPDEGFYSPAFEIFVGYFMRALGFETVIGARHFGHSATEMDVSDCLDPEDSCFPEMCAPDLSVYIAIYTDFHHALVCQTEDSWRKVKPAEFFEGFQADEHTDDHWGLVFPK